MKTNKIWVAVALALALVSCKSEPAKEGPQQKMDYPVALSLDGGKSGAMRATGKSNSLSASNPNERAIENLTVVVFLNNNATSTPGAVEKVITYDKLTKPTDPYQGEFKFDMGMAGTYQLEVIANGYKDDADKDAFINQFKRGLSYDQFKNIVFERALPNNGETGFAMLSTEPKKVATLVNKTAHAGTIKLRRLACRFDVYNKLTDELKLTKVTLQNQTDKSYLMTQGTVPANASNAPKEYTAASGTWFTPTVISAGIYSYENPVKGAVKLQLEGEYKGQAWEKTIELRDKDGKYVATQRNHIYRVHLTKGNGTTPGGGNKDKDNITYNIEVLDWDEDAAMDYSDSDLMDAEHINPLAYVAEYNIDEDGNFVTDLYATNVGGYYDFDTAVAKFSHITIGGEAYHLPSIDEWIGIIAGKEPSPRIWFDRAVSKRDQEIEVVLAGKSINCLQDVEGTGNNECYALRFKGTVFQSAWKYEYIKVNNYQVMRITSRLVADGVTIEDVIKGNFWTQNNSRDIVRIFPASGMFKSSWVNEIGYYWSSTPIDGLNADNMWFMKPFVNTGYVRTTRRDFRYSIRLFKDTLE